MTRAWRVPLVAFLTSRTVLLLVVYLGLVFIATPAAQDKWHAFSDFRVLDGWERWDSKPYWDIAKNGWSSWGHFPTVNYFPLYSGVCRVASAPLRLFLAPERAFYAAGLLLSHLAFLAALAGLYRLTAAASDERAASRAVWLVVLFPFAFFASAVYTESLYLALVVWAFDSARRERWAMASALVCLAGATRIVGFVAVGALMLEHLRRRGWRLGNLRRDAWWLLLAPLGYLGVLAYAWHLFGDPFLSYKVQMTAHNRTVAVGHLVDAVRETLAAHGEGLVLDVWNLLLMPVAAVLGVHAWRRFGAGAGAFVLGSLGVAALSGFAGMGRYVLVMFPLFMSAGTLCRRPLVFAAVCAIFVPFQLWFANGFAHWAFIT